MALIRNTLQQLRQTVLADTVQYLGECVHYYVTDGTLQIRLKLPDGTSVHSDWMLLPLDTQGRRPPVTLAPADRSVD